MGKVWIGLDRFWICLVKFVKVWIGLGYVWDKFGYVLICLDRFAMGLAYIWISLRWFG